jgi:hypothetical protein
MHDERMHATMASRGDPALERLVRWPIHMRIGQL